MNYVKGDNSQNASVPSEDHEEKDFPEALHHERHMTSPIPNLRTQACQINFQL